VAALNDELDLGLTRRELARIPDRRTVIDSQRWGVMWHGAGSVNIAAAGDVPRQGAGDRPDGGRL
jgi:hypothetical protein